MPDWTNPPAGNPPPVAGNPPTPAWNTHINDIWDLLNPPPKVFPAGNQDCSQTSRDVTWFLSGDNPTPWRLSGNKKKGKLNFNIWTRTYPTLTVQTFRILTLTYWLRPVRTRVIHTEVFWIPQGPPVAYKNAMVYYVKPSSVHKDGIYVKIDPSVSIEFGPDEVRISVGGVSVDFPDIPIIESEDSEVNTEPTPDEVQVPPDGAKQGDPAKDPDLLPQFSGRIQDSKSPVRFAGSKVGISLGLEAVSSPVGSGIQLQLAFAGQKFALPASASRATRLEMEIDTTSPERAAMLPGGFFGTPVRAGDLASVSIISAQVEPEGGPPGRETVTLINAGVGTRNVVGWQIVDQDGNKTPLPADRIDEGYTLRVKLDGQGARLGLRGGTITLADEQGVPVHTVAYAASRTRRTHLF